MRLRISLALAVALSAAAGAQQPQQPVFRSGVQVVEVDARVFDRDGRFVTDLTIDDFEILEDGVPQDIVALTLVGTATTTPTPPTPPPSTDTTAPTESHVPTTPAPAPQTWIFFFDSNHLTPGGGFDRARKAVESFVAERFREGDLAGVVADGKMIGGRLTSLRPEILSYVRQVKPRTESRNRVIEMTREWPRFRNEEEVLQVARRIGEATQRVITRACSEDPDSCQMAESMVEQKAMRLASTIQKESFETFNTINGLATGLARVPGPKSIVFLSNGFASFGLENTIRNVVGQAARAGARVYAIDVRGLDRGGSVVDAVTYDDAAGGPPVFDALADGVNSLAVDTGGLMIRNENNIGRALGEIAEDAGTYYVLGYQPANTNFDGKYRKIEIKVKRQDLRVRARQGYLALDPSKMTVPQRIR